MSIVLIISIAIRIAALAWTLRLLRQIRDWRIGFMAAIVGLMALRQTLTLRMGIESEATELPGLAVSVMIFLAVVFLGRLLTERQRAEEALRKSEASLAAAQERAKVGSWELDVATQTGYWSAEMFRLFNHDPSRGAPTFAEFLEMVHPDDRHDLEKRHAEAGQTAAQFELEFRSNPAQGAVKTFNAFVHTIRNAAAQVVQLAGTVQDISGRKAAEEKLKTHYRELQALQEISQNILNSLDLQLIVDGILDKMLSLGSFDLGAIRLLDSRGEHLEAIASQGYHDTKNVPHLSTDPSIHRSRMMLTRVMTEKKTQVVENLPRFDGLRSFKKEGVQSAIVVPVLAQGQILGTIQLGSRKPRKFAAEEIHLLEAIGSQMGIAVQKARLYQEVKNHAIALERANKVKDEFLSVMSHEIRTPLNTFIGYAEMVREKILGELNQKQEEALGKALHQAGHLLDMLNRVLLTTQIDAGMVRVESDEVSLGEFLDRLKPAYDIPLAKDVTMVWNYPSDLPVIKTDRNRLKHILQNLINNAIKFTRNGRVEISARHVPDSRCVELRVADTGIGIPKESLPTIFDKFRQVDSSETRLYGGVGLGLYIAKQMTEKLGGTLEVKSERGKGSIFLLTIPVKV